MLYLIKNNNNVYEPISIQYPSLKINSSYQLILKNMYVNHGRIENYVYIIYYVQL